MKIRPTLKFFSCFCIKCRERSKINIHWINGGAKFKCFNCEQEEFLRLEDPTETTKKEYEISTKKPLD